MQLHSPARRSPRAQKNGRSPGASSPAGHSPCRRRSSRTREDRVVPKQATRRPDPSRGRRTYGAPGGLGRQLCASPSLPVANNASQEQHPASISPLLPGLHPRLPSPPPSSGRVSGGHTPPPRYLASAILSEAGRMQCAGVAPRLPASASLAERELYNAQPCRPLRTAAVFRFGVAVFCLARVLPAFPELYCSQINTPFCAAHSHYAETCVVPTMCQVPG